MITAISVLSSDIPVAVNSGRGHRNKSRGGVGYEMVVRPWEKIFCSLHSQKIIWLSCNKSVYTQKSCHVLFVVQFVNIFKYHYKMLKRCIAIYTVQNLPNTCSLCGLLLTKSFATSASTNLSVTSLCTCKIMRWLSLP